MGIGSGILSDWHASAAALQWLRELGADEAIGETPVNRYEVAQAQAASAPAAPPPRAAAVSASPPAPPDMPAADAVAVARGIAGQAGNLGALAAGMAAYDLCELKRGARNFVFSDGNPAARVMVIGEAPGRDEDIEGRPFVGRAGKLLDRMFAAIGLARTAADAEAALYITNVLPWRPPQNRDPEPVEIAMMLPFLERHVELAAPDLIVLMGNTPCAAALGRRGILRLRGNWTQAFGRPVLPMTHPAYLLRNPIAKRDAWADLLAIRARLREGA